jgi:D-3-phosphoglycerate dehydrogenase
MTRCLVVQRIHPAGLAVLEAAGIDVVMPLDDTPEAVLRRMPMVSAAITRNKGLSTEAIAAATGLKVIGVHGTGTDAVPVAEATRRGIVVFNTPGRNDRSVAEHAIGLVLAVTKGIVAGDAAVRGGDPGFRDRVRLTEIEGLNLGIVGYGSIGRLTARLGAALGLSVTVWSRSVDDAELRALGFGRARTLHHLLAAADVVSLHLPLTPETRGLIGVAELGLMKPGAVIVNTARGALVDEAALASALTDGRIGGAGLDVFAAEPLPAGSPLLACPNLVLTPHLAGSASAALERTAIAVATDIVGVLQGQRPANVVNPSVYEALP